MKPKLIALQLMSVCAGVFVLQLSWAVEVGSNDFRISSMQGLGNSNYIARNPAVAFNATENEYLVVWEGINKPPFALPTSCWPLPTAWELDIYAQRVDADTGALLGPRHRVSDSCPKSADTFYPAVVWNATNNEYLVAWKGEALDGVLNGLGEVFIQRLSATGAILGSSRINRISNSDEGDELFEVGRIDIAWNSADNQYLVVWNGGNYRFGQTDYESEVYGQLLDDDGVEIGFDDFRISDMSSDGSEFGNVNDVAVAWNPVAQDYLVVWSGDDPDVGLLPGEAEIFGQLLEADSSEKGANDFMISDLFGIGEIAWDARHADVAWNSLNNEYMVVWDGIETDEAHSQVFAQRLNVNGVPQGLNDVQISESTSWAEHPSIAWNPVSQRYMVTWAGGGNSDFPERNEIYAQEVAVDYSRSLPLAPAITNVGTGLLGDQQRALSPAIASTQSKEAYLVVYSAVDYQGYQVANEFEIFGQRLGGNEVFVNGFETPQ